MSHRNDSQHLLADKTPKEGVFDAAVIDPPWVAGQRGRLGAETHYQLMENDTILKMGEAVRHIMAEDSWCFLWVTNATLELGFEVLRQYGFKPSNFYFWAKPKFGLGYDVRNAGEICLIGRRGKVKPAFRGQPNWGFHPVQAHSHKPEEFHMVVERLVGGPARLVELFARRPAPSMAGATGSTWDVWGNEVQSTISLARWGYPVPSDFDEQDHSAAGVTADAAAPSAGGAS